MEYITFPWEQIGAALRALSLLGNAGNAAAWILFFIIGALPLAVAGILRLSRRGCRADLLLAALSVMLYIGVWFYANPSYMSLYLLPMPEFEFSGYVLAAVLDSLLFTWLLLRCVLRYEKLEYQKLLSGLKFLLYAYAAILAAGSLWSRGAAFMASCKALGENNNGADGLLLNISLFFLILQSIVKLIPVFAEVALLIMAAGFLGSFEREAFGADACSKLERLRTVSGRLLMLILLSNVGISVLQLLFARFILSSSYVIVFPLAEIIVVLGIRTLCFLYLEGRRLKEENEMFV